MTSTGFESTALNKYRGYLQFLSRHHLQEQYRGKLEYSDIVQQSLLQAFAARAQFQGQTEAERLAWLRKILVRQVAHATRDLHAQKRDVKRERSIEAAWQESSQRLTQFFSDGQAPPSQQMMRRESIQAVAEAMALLPEDQRQVLLLRYWNQSSIQDISKSLGKSSTAVAGLLHRATKKLRSRLRADES